MYPLFLALRYARSRAVTYLAFLTVAVSVCSFVVVMGVLGGFRHRAEEIITKLGSPLEVYCGSVEGISDAGDLAEDLAADVPGARGAAPYVQSMTLMRTARYRTTALVRGIDLDKEIRYGAIGEYLLSELPPRKPPGEEPESGKEQESHALRDLGHSLMPWLVDAAASGNGGVSGAPKVTSLKVPEGLEGAVIPESELDPWEKNAPPPGAAEEEGPERGTLPIWGGSEPPRDGSAQAGVVHPRDPDSAPPLPPPPPEPKPGRKPAPKAEPIPRGAIVGVERARKLGLWPGDELILTTQGEDQEPRSRSFIVVGFYETKTQWLDEGVFIDRRAAHDLSGSKTATGISIWLDDPRRADEALPRAQEVVGRASPYRMDIKVRTWRETRQEDFVMLELQDRVMMIILLVLFALNGAFIMAILWVLVSDKTRDIGTVRALGAGRLGVVATFVCQGLAIGVFGVVLGLSLGLALSEHVNGVTNSLDAGLHKVDAGLAWANNLAQHCGLGRPLGGPYFEGHVFGGISSGLFGMSRLSVFYDPVHMVAVVCMTILVSFLASLFPAWRASRLDPVEALRHD